MDCRMYENEYPEEDDIITAKVINWDNDALLVHCQLLEYNNKECVMEYANIQRRRRMRSMPLKKNEVIFCQVISVDENFINISKKHMSVEETEMAKDNYSKNKSIFNMFKRVSHVTNEPMINLYENFGWKVGQDIYGGIEKIYKEKGDLKDFELKDNVKEEMLKAIDKRFQAKYESCQCMIEMTCFTIEGILAIKETMKDGIEYYKEKYDDENFRIYYNTAPQYGIITKTLNLEETQKQVDDVINRMKENLEKRGGNFKSTQKLKIIQEDGK